MTDRNANLLAMLDRARARRANFTEMYVPDKHAPDSPSWCLYGDGMFGVKHDGSICQGGPSADGLNIYVGTEAQVKALDFHFARTFDRTDDRYVLRAMPFPEACAAYLKNLDEGIIGVLERALDPVEVA